MKLKTTTHSALRSIGPTLRQAILVSLCLVLAGCSQGVPQSGSEPPRPAIDPAPSESGGAPAENGATRFPLEVTDGLGRTVKVAKIPRRIVSLSPKNTEMLFAIGAGDQTVGTTTYCNYPPAASKTEKVGGFSAKSLSLERIVGVQPDLVVSVGDLHVPIIEELERLNIPVVAFAADSFAGLYADLQLLGQITGHEAETEKLVQTLIARVNRVKDTANNIPASARVTAMYYVWGEPLTGAGPNSYFGEMIQFCGAINIIEETSTRFHKITMEVLLARNPDVIISSTNHSDLVSMENVESRPGWNRLKAVQTQRVHLLEGSLVSRCTPRTVDALELMAHAIYPDYFAAPHAEHASIPASGQQP